MTIMKRKEGVMGRIVLITVLIFSMMVMMSRGQENPWGLVDEALEKGIATFGYPGAVALVGDEEGILYYRAVGNYTYGRGLALNNNANPPMALDTLFDLASCSKVTAATSAIAQFYQRGQLDLSFSFPPSPPSSSLLSISCIYK